MLEEIVTDLGFESKEEFFVMVVKVDFTKVSISTFKAWQKEDGSKAGLERLLNN